MPNCTGLFCGVILIEYAYEFNLCSTWKLDTNHFYFFICRFFCHISSSYNCRQLTKYHFIRTQYHYTSVNTMIGSNIIFRVYFILKLSSSSTLYYLLQHFILISLFEHFILISCLISTLFFDSTLLYFNTVFRFNTITCFRDVFRMLQFTVQPHAHTHRHFTGSIKQLHEVIYVSLMVNQQ